MDKNIHDEIENEIEGIVYDDNDTDAEVPEEEAADTEDVKEEAEENKETEASVKESEEPSEEESEAGEEEADDKEPELEEESTEEKTEPEGESGGEEPDTEEEGAEEETESEKDGSGEADGDSEEKKQGASLAELIAARKKKMRHLKVALILPAIAIIIAGMVALYLISERNQRYDNLLNVDYFYEGIYVDDIALGGYTLDEAKEKIEESNILKKEAAQAVLLWDEEKIVFKSDEMDIKFNSEEVLEKAWKEGREGTDKQRYEYVLNLIQNPVRFSTDMEVDPSPIEAKIKAVALFKQRDPGEASVKFNPDPELDGSEWFEYSEPQKGITTDPEGLWQAVKASFEKSTEAQIEIPREEVAPTTTIDDLKDMTQLIVQFKSHMVRNTKREHNVALACSMINGTVLLPGEVFSMNETTGKRTKEAGFLEANVIVGGNRLEPGIAGGVCQVSGTLFNAAVRADLEIVERQHHSFELSYLTRGRDATVNYGTADLRFKNTSDNPIYISMYVIGRDVYAEIYGVPLPDGMSIELYVKTTDTIAPGPPVYVADSTVPYGTTEVYSARTGIKCTTYKDYYDANGKLVERVELHRDYYRPYAKEIHYNPAAGIPVA